MATTKKLNADLTQLIQQMVVSMAKCKGDKAIEEALSSLVPILHSASKGRKPQVMTLTEKELEVLKWARAGKTSWEIGIIRDISESTVKYHFKSIYSKLGVSNRAQAVGEALYQGIIK